MLAEFIVSERLPLDYTPISYFPSGFDIPLKCSKLIKLFYGYVKLLDVHAIRYNDLDIRTPLKNTPDKYTEFLNISSVKEYQTHREACQHLLYLTMTSVTRDNVLVTEFLKQSRLYDSESISDDWINKQIKDYADPRTIHYTLKVMLLEDKFQITNSAKYRLPYDEVYLQFKKLAVQMNRTIESKGQLSRGLNRLIKQKKGITGIVKSRRFGKSTRHLAIDNVYPTFFYKTIPSPAEIRQRARLIR